MKLGIKERIGLMNLLPEQAGFVDMGIIRALQKELNFSEEEIKKFQLKDVIDKEGKASITWNKEAEEEVDFHISDNRNRVICEAFIKYMNTNQDIPQGVTHRVFDSLSWSKDNWQELVKSVHKMDENEKITSGNYELCEKIIYKDDKAPETKS